MATTHHFANEKNYAQGGRWADDYGRTICRWTWDIDTRVLSVRCGNRGRTKDLSSFDREHLTDDKLRDQLPPLALGLAEQLTGDKDDV